MYYPGLAPLSFEVPSLGHDVPGGDKPGHQAHPSLHPSQQQQQQPPHPTATQTLQRRPHTPHMSLSHTPSHNGGGNPHSHVPHHTVPAPSGAHQPPPQHHVDSDNSDKKSSMKMDGERKSKCK